jgi:hypothetical protein
MQSPAFPPRGNTAAGGNGHWARFVRANIARSFPERKVSWQDRQTLVRETVSAMGRSPRRQRFVVLLMAFACRELMKERRNVR